ncbi:hypothetical protein [Streptomyces goshikiensis]|uniref:hypothetical protein n=1 Tax=Streptomyces goshikiensis TaxID=1942 RepID=UPI0036923E38
MDPAHQVPEDGVDEKTVRALGALSKALETSERACGHLYGFHQLTGTADFELGDAVRHLRETGHEEQADRVEREILGRNVILGHWTFQITEARLKTAEGQHPMGTWTSTGCTGWPSGLPRSRSRMSRAAVCPAFGEVSRVREFLHDAYPLPRRRPALAPTARERQAGQWRERPSQPPS